MDIFTQKKLLVRIIIILILLNCIIISAFVWKDFIRRPVRQERPENNKDVSAILQKELNLSNEQFRKIKEIRDEFSQKEQDLSASIKAERDSMNNNMFRAVTDDELVIAMAKRIAENEYRMEMLRFEQAKAIKSVCTKEQLDRFESLIRELRDYLKGSNPADQNRKQGREPKPKRENKPRKERGPERK